MKINSRWITESRQFIFNHKPKGCCLMTASVDLKLGPLEVCQEISTERLHLFVMGKNFRSIVGYQFHYLEKPLYVFQDEKLFWSFFSPPNKKCKAKVLYQDSLLMVNVFGKTEAISVTLKNKYWV